MTDNKELYDVVLKSESRVSDKLIQYQTEKLLNVIKLKKLYRKGDYLFDTEKLHPHYNILEFAWTFCEYPPIANQVAESLESRLVDIPNSDDDKDISKLVAHFKYNVIPYIDQMKHTRDPELIRFIWFAMSRIKNGDYEHVALLAQLLRELNFAKWEPASKFQVLLHKYYRG